MQQPLQINFKNMETSEAVEATIRKWVDKLERAHNTIISCRVVVEAPPMKKRHGGLYHTRIELTLPGGELVINRRPDLHHSFADVNVSVRDAFKSAQRRLEERVKRKQGEEKHHEAPCLGRVKALAPAEDHGWIETADGREIYFHRNSLLEGDFDKLATGSEVRFVEQEDGYPLRASSVRLIGKHHPA